jgi:hypothetical protein
MQLGPATVIAFEVAAVRQSAVNLHMNLIIQRVCLILINYVSCRVLRASLACRCLHFSSAGNSRPRGCLDPLESTVLVEYSFIRSFTIGTRTAPSHCMDCHCEHYSMSSWASSIAVHNCAAALSAVLSRMLSTSMAVSVFLCPLSAGHPGSKRFQQRQGSECM